MSTELVITTVTAILLALVGYLVTYLNDLRLAQRAEKLERVNKQLEQLYGPMFALTQASNIAWQAFRTIYRPEYATYFGAGEPPTEEELKAWRLWMSSVFMPINLRIYEAIVSNTHLLMEEEMPGILLNFCAHVEAYRTVLKQWEENDFSKHTSVVNYPVEILEYAQRCFMILRKEQAELLGVKRAKRYQ